MMHSAFDLILTLTVVLILTLIHASMLLGCPTLPRFWEGWVF